MDELNDLQGDASLEEGRVPLPCRREQANTEDKATPQACTDRGPAARLLAAVPSR